jgi:hypothetical protein
MADLGLIADSLTTTQNSLPALATAAVRNALGCGTLVPTVVRPLRHGEQALPQAVQVIRGMRANGAPSSSCVAPGALPVSGADTDPSARPISTSGDEDPAVPPLWRRSTYASACAPRARGPRLSAPWHQH